jgi:hypothetical protein
MEVLPMSFFEERDVARLGHEARAWLMRDRDPASGGRDLARRGREARDWLTHDERGRVIGLVIFSVAISILMSLLATAIVGFVSRRRASVTEEPVVPEVMGEPLAAVEAPVGIPVMDAAAVPEVAESHVEA